jgi:ABC-type cobalamin/Fe3+-siderophores transport system ATPase subunit
MRNSKEGLTFKNIDITNFKNISKTVVDIGGQSILILGKNGAGKSSFIQALMSPLDTKVRPSQPIKEGEERSTISVTLAGVMGGKEKEYILDLYFTPGDQKGRLVITNSEGETVKSPATFIKSLIGNVSFDVTKWLNESKEKKLTTLKQLTGCSEKIDEINLVIKDLKEKKKFKNQRVEEIQAVLKNHGYTPEDVDKYSNPVDLTPIQTEMNEVSKNQQTYDGVVAKLKQFEEINEISAGKILDANKEISRLKELILIQENIEKEQKELIAKNKENIIKGEEWVKSKIRPSIEAVSEKLNEAIKHNEHFNKIQVHAGQQREMLAAKTELDTIASQVLVEEKKRNDIVSASQLPIHGLSFDDEQIYLDSLPLEEGQINTARLWDVGVDIAIALNPGLKTIFLHDGSLFDKEHMKAIIEKIENKGFQAIIEVVKSEGDLEVGFTEKFLAE